MIRAAIFDVDGVLVNPGELFSVQYARKYNLDSDSFTVFFKGDFIDALNGRADLKDLILKHYDIWHWDEDPQVLLDAWFEAENLPDQAMLNLVKNKKNDGLPIYTATNQEKHRGQYIKNIMFPGLFKDYFISADLGCEKKDNEFWTTVLEQIAIDVPGISPSEIVFFDDDQKNIDSAKLAGIDAYLCKNDLSLVEEVLN